MSVTSYLTIARDGVAQIEESRSRFRCTVARVSDEEGARAVVEQVRKQHWDARHHCTAFVVGPDRAIEGSSDAGEPAGTGGAPMLELLRGRELTDVVAVCSRWFGGTLLGTGGLARAYAGATRAALDEVGVVERVMQDLCEVEVDIAAVGQLEHALRSRGARVLGVEYTGEASLRFAIPPVARAVAEEIVAELTSGTASLEVIGQRWVDSGR
ncbi:MAG: YigZ family protein [Marmoricola sp.]|nr:YigZ family protein [Marmoricola sp.]